MNDNTSKLVFVLAFIVGAILTFNFFILPTLKEAPLRVVYFSPEDKSINVPVSTQIRIDFNRPLKNTKEARVFLMPQAQLKLTLENKQKTLLVNLTEPLHSRTTYHLEVKNQENKTILQSAFTTEQLQGDPSVPYEGERYTQKNYPLLEFIPYETEEFSLSYNGPLVLKVVIKKGNKETIKPHVLRWIKSHGVDPSNHQIKWVTPEP